MISSKFNITIIDGKYTDPYTLHTITSSQKNSSQIVYIQKESSITVQMKHDSLPYNEECSDSPLVPA